MALTEDLILRIGAVDGASSVFGIMENAVSDAFQKMTGASNQTVAALDRVSTASTAAKGALIATGIGAAIAAGGAFVTATAKAKELGEKLFEMSQRTGVSAESLSTLKFAAEQSGLSLDQIEGGLTKLARTMAAAIQDETSKQAQLFRTMGVAVAGANGQMRAADEVMADLADVISGVQSPSERAALAMQLFGKSGADLLPILLGGKQGMAALQQQARDLGLEVSGESAANADAFGDKWDALVARFEGWGVSIGNVLIPWLSSGIDWLVKIGETWVDVATIWGQADLLWFEPIRLGWSLVGVALTEGVVTVVNFVGDVFSRGINGIIAGWNRLGAQVGLTIDEIEWEPLTTDPANTFSAQWEASKQRVVTGWETINTTTARIASRFTENTGSMADGAQRAATKTSILSGNIEDLADTADGASEDVKKVPAALEMVGDAGVELDPPIDQMSILNREVVSLDTNLQAVDWEAALPPDGFATSFMGTLKEGLGSDFSRAAIGEGLGNGVSDAMMALAEGGGWKEAADALGTTIGSVIGGPVGALVGRAISGAAGMLGNLFGGTSRSESRRNVIAELQQSITQGDIRNFAAFNNMGRALADAGSARLTLDAFMETFGLSQEESAELIRLLDESQLGIPANQERIAYFNEKLGANAALAALALGASLVRGGPPAPGEMSEEDRIAADLDNRFFGDDGTIEAAVGYDGLVTRPTMFLTGEAGPERVTVTPYGEAGYQGSAGPNIYITNHIQAWDRRDMAAFVDGELMPMVQRQLQRLGRRGAWVTDTSGIRNVETV